MAHQIVLKEEVFEAIKQECLVTYDTKEKEVTGLLMRLMDIEGVPMHYPYHHFILPAVLLTTASVVAEVDRKELMEMLDKAKERSKNVLAGFCGNYGTCGAGVGTGLFVSIFTDATPMSEENWQWANEITGLSLQKISTVPGPRCCKRTCFLALLTAVPYIKEKMGLELELTEPISCKYHEQNKDCKKELCPFYK